MKGVSPAQYLLHSPWACMGTLGACTGSPYKCSPYGRAHAVPVWTRAEYCDWYLQTGFSQLTGNVFQHAACQPWQKADPPIQHKLPSGALLWSYSRATRNVGAVWLSRCQEESDLLLLEVQNKAISLKLQRIQFSTRVPRLMVTNMMLAEEWMWLNKRWQWQSGVSGHSDVEQWRWLHWRLCWSQ